MSCAFLQPRCVPVIVIVGGGFAGIAVARRLERRLRPEEAEIVLLSRENFSLFTPMLPEVTSGELEVRHVVTPIRAQLHRTRFVLADVDEVDVARSTIRYHHVLTGISTTLHYDHVVLALGSSTSTFGLPGVAEHVCALKTLEDADASAQPSGVAARARRYDRRRVARASACSRSSSSAAASPASKRPARSSSFFAACCAFTSA